MSADERFKRRVEQAGPLDVTVLASSAPLPEGKRLSAKRLEEIRQCWIADEQPVVELLGHIAAVESDLRAAEARIRELEAKPARRAP